MLWNYGFTYCKLARGNLSAIVVLLILTSQPIDAMTVQVDGKNARETHGSPPTYIEWVILVYVVGKQALDC